MATPTEVSSRVLNPKLAEKIMGAEEAAALIQSGDQGGHEQLHRVGVPEGSSDRAGEADCGWGNSRPEVSVQRLYRPLDRSGAGRRTGDGGRDQPAAEVSVEPRDAETHQRRRDEIDGHPSEPRGAVRGVRVPEQARRGAE